MERTGDAAAARRLPTHADSTPVAWTTKTQTTPKRTSRRTQKRAIVRQGDSDEVRDEKEEEEAGHTEARAQV